MFRVLIAAAVAVLLALVPGLSLAQEAPRPQGDNLMKACGDQWRAVRAAETANGVTWPQFLSRCRADAAKTAAAPAAPAAAPAAPAPAQPGPKAAAAPDGKAAPAARVAAAPVFPGEVFPKHSGERPALARQRTCAEQFKVNKASGANGGLRWIEQGGGYWSRCNAHLKQARA